MKDQRILAGFFIVAVLFFACCTGTQTPTEDTTSTTVEATTTTQAATTTSVSPASTTTTETSTTSSTSTTKPLPPIPKNITSTECYAKGFFWCAGKCSRTECGDCFSYKRCIVLNDTAVNNVKVETAQQVPYKEGSCEYAGTYTNAGGKESYCDKNEGNLIYAKCGVDRPDPSDCYKLSGGNQTNRAPYGSRSFHSNLGAEYDLWCFRCDVVGQ
jgi:hypothetical protein